MKKVNYSLLSTAALSIAILSSCAGLNKMNKNADQVEYKVTPEILEAHKGEVAVAIQGRIPQKYFAKKVNLVATPVLVYDGGETSFDSYELQGEKVSGNAETIEYKAGGDFSYKGDVDFIDAMRKGELEIRITGYKGSKSKTFDPIKVADGTIATSELVSKKGATITGIQKEENTTGKYDPTIDKFQRVVPEEMEADLMYLINSSYLRGEEMNKEEIEALTQYVKDAEGAERIDLKGVEVSAYASPDGEKSWNSKLSEKREGTSSKFVSKKFSSADIVAQITSKYTPEDWDGFQKLMEQSDIRDKELILRVLSMYNDAEVREREIKNLAAAYTSVADDILPQLRRAKVIASVDLIGKTDAEILDMAKNNASALNQAELIYALSLTDDLDLQAQFCSSFINQWSDDWRGYNNLGMVQFKQDKADDADKNFNKADKLDRNNPIVQNNLAVIAIFNGDAATAEKLLGAASGAGNEVKANLGTVAILNGEYSKAVKLFGECNCVNSALASILAGDNNGALKKLEASKCGCPKVSYLKAIVGARTAKSSLLYTNLEAACSKCADLKEIAGVDLEFVNYFEDSKFQAIVK